MFESNIPKAAVVDLSPRAQAPEVQRIPKRAEHMARLYEILEAVEADDLTLFENRLNQLMRWRNSGA